MTSPSPRYFKPNVDWRALHDLGFSLIPVRAGEKIPVTQWARFQAQRATLEEISEWQRAGHNAGIVTGAISGVVVLDLDSEAALSEAVRRGFPETLTVSTARGRHLYFRHPGIPVRNKVKIFLGADLRGDGGFVVAPGSVHETGTEYVWLTEPAWTEIAPAPEWLIEKLRSRPETEPQSTAQMSTTTPYGRSALDRELTILRNAEKGSRNDQLNRSAHALAQLAAGRQIDTAEAKQALHHAALSIGLEADEIERTLESGWRTGFLAPRVPKQGNGEPSPHENIFSARTLSEMTFEPLRWAIPGLLPEGLALLAGRPKFGKSFLSLQMAVAVATGEGRAFGTPEIEAGDVLVCALEDSRRRLKERLARMYPFGGAPDRLHFATSWPRIGQGCTEALDAWCDAHPEARLIILDTWRAIKPPGSVRGSAYDEDAIAAAPLLKFAKRRPGLAIVVVHHVRKTDADDVFDTISGTHGLTGIFDTLQVLTRHGAGAKLAAQGRDLDGYEKSLERDRRTGGWIVNGEVIGLAKTGERQELLDLLAKAEGPLSLSEIAEAVGKKSDAVWHLLKPLVEEGSVSQPGHGRYAIVSSQFTQDAQFGEEHSF